MSEKGLTLVELMVTLAIAMILVAALGFSYQGWNGRYGVESAAKTLYADLMDARAQSMQKNATFLADITTNSYRIARDANENITVENSEVQPTFPKKLSYTINGAPILLAFSSRGIISQVTAGPVNQSIDAPVTISISSSDTEVKPDYDCLRIYATEMHLGRMNGGVCNEE